MDILAHGADIGQDLDAVPRSRRRRYGRKRHGFRPNGADERRGSGTSTLAGSERTARSTVRAQLRVTQLLTRTVG